MFIKQPLCCRLCFLPSQNSNRKIFINIYFHHCHMHKFYCFILYLSFIMYTLFNCYALLLLTANKQLDSIILCPFCIQGIGCKFFLYFCLRWSFLAHYSHCIMEVDSFLFATEKEPILTYVIFNLRIILIFLAGVAQWIEWWPASQRVAGSIPSQGTCLGCRPGPQ